MSLTVYLYNQVNVDRIRFASSAYKKTKEMIINGETLSKNIHYIDITYNKNPLYVQFERSQLNNLKGGQAQISINDSVVETFIQPLQEHIVKSVHKHSETWFQGKRFTMNKIKNCILSAVTYVQDVPLLNLTVSKNLRIFDQYKKEIKDKDIIELSLPIEAIALVKIANLQFIDNRFTYNMSLEQLKVYKSDPLHEYSIMDSGTSTEIEDTRDDEYYRDSREIDSMNKPFF